MPSDLLEVHCSDYECLAATVETLNAGIAARGRAGDESPKLAVLVARRDAFLLEMVQTHARIMRYLQGAGR